MNKKNLFVCILLTILLGGVFVHFPPILAATIFYDGFESGDMSKWSMNNNVAVTDNSIAVYNGTYGANCTWSDGGWCGAGYVLPSPQTTIYFTEFIKLDSLPNDYIQSFGFMSESEGGGGSTYHCDLYNDSGVWRWLFLHADTSSVVDANVVAGVWWSLQIGVTPTWCAFWIDGVLMKNDTGTYTSVAEPFMGAGHYESGSNTHTIYIDDVYIGTTSLFQKSFTLTIASAGGGTTDPTYGTYTYVVNSSVNVMAIPDINYTFDHFELDTVNVGSTNPYTVIMTANHTLRAVFTFLLSITPDSASVDLGQSVDFVCTTDGGTPPYSFQWYLNDAPVPEATSSTWTFTPSSEGVYTVYTNVTDDVGVTAKSGIALVAVSSPPSVTISPASAILNVGETLLFTSNASDGTPPYSYQWFLNSTIVLGATNPNWTFAPSSGGYYAIYVEVTDNVGMKATSDNSTVTVGSFDVAVTDVTPSKTVIGQGYNLNINVTLENQGDDTATFSITVYVNTTEIETRIITLSGEDVVTITLTWNTVGFVKGNYTVWAYAEPVEGETDTEDNTFTDGNIYAGIPGDIAPQYGLVDMKDIGMTLKAFGTSQGSPKWNPNADINCDGKVDMKDVGIAVKNFGKQK